MQLNNNTKQCVAQCNISVVVQ